jgi:hypothetical protein
MTIAHGSPQKQLSTPAPVCPGAPKKRHTTSNAVDSRTSSGRVLFPPLAKLSFTDHKDFISTISIAERHEQRNQ